MTQKAGFTSVEIGPIVSNNRVDSIYKPADLEATGYSARASTMMSTFEGRKMGQKKTVLFASVQPSFSLVNLPPEYERN